MTVVTHFFSHPEYLFKIDRQCYLPAPAVHGALAMFTLKQSHERPPVRSEREFRTFVQRAFSGKRKMITNSLAPQWAREDVEHACAAIGVSPEVRCSSILRACSCAFCTGELAGVTRHFLCLLSTEQPLKTTNRCVLPDPPAPPTSRTPLAARPMGSTLVLLENDRASLQCKCTVRIRTQARTACKSQARPCGRRSARRTFTPRSLWSCTRRCATRRTRRT